MNFIKAIFTLLMLPVKAVLVLPLVILSGIFMILSFLFARLLVMVHAQAGYSVLGLFNLKKFTEKKVK